MANWNNPLITTQYDVFVAEVKDRDVDTATMFRTDPVAQPVGAVRFNRTTKIFEEWSGTAWTPIIIGITGGGTGANSGAGAGTALGLGTMAFQNSDNVFISNGTAVLNIIYSYTGVHPGADNAADLGVSNQAWRYAYIKGGLVIPVGVDKYIVG